MIFPRKESSSNYDLIVVGAGSGLNVVSHAANNLEWRVALVEEGPLGGTCLNRGCIPSKIIIHAADAAEGVRKAADFGVNAKVESVDFEKVIARASSFVDGEAVQIEEGIRKHEKIDLYKARGEFTGDKTLRVGNKEITGERVLIAAGTRPFVPPIEGIENVDYLTSTEALRLKKQPKSMLIIGGGYISAELGHFFGALGTKITVVERGEKLVKREDEDVSRVFTEVFSRNYDVALESKVVKVEKSGLSAEASAREGNMKKITVEDKAGNQTIHEAEALLVSTGRSSNSDILKLKDNTSIALDKKGFVTTNEFMETNVPGVWALGDIVGKAPFKHGANWEARHINFSLSGNKKSVDYSVMPHAIFSHPQVAGVGLTEQEAREKGIKYDIRKKKYIKTGMGKAIEEHDGFIKYIIEPREKKILGCHIIGPHASILIHEVIIALNTGGDMSAITDSIHIHPSLSELVGWAF